MVHAGIPCHVCKGVDLNSGYREAGRDICKGVSGKMHSKFLLAGPYLVIGSTNWTSSSKGNQETSVLVFLNGEGYAMMHARCQRLIKASETTLQGKEGIDELVRIRGAHDMARDQRHQQRAQTADLAHPPEPRPLFSERRRSAPRGAGVGDFPATSSTNHAVHVANAG